MTEKCNSYRVDGKEIHLDGRREYQGLQKLTKEIRQIVQPILGKHGFANADIIENWPLLVGEDLARGIMPDHLHFDRQDRKNGVLYVKSAGGAFAMLLEHQKMRVIEKINMFFGYPAVGSIKIIQGTLKLKKPVLKKEVKRLSQKQMQELEKKVEQIEDLELRQKVLEVGIALLKKEG